VRREPLAHRFALVGVERLAVASGHEFVHPPGGKLDHEVTADEHREDLPAVAQRAAPETAAAVRQRHAVGVAELADKILEPQFRRRVWRHDDRVSPYRTFGPRATYCLVVVVVRA